MIRRMRIFEEDEQAPPRKLQRFNFENLGDATFEETFRLNTSEFEFVLECVGQSIQHQSKKNFALSPQQQLMTALHWFGSGQQYHGIGFSHGISKSTVCRVVHRVANAICDLMFDGVVTWPEDPSQIPAEFETYGGFPFVAGLADGSLVNIDAPTINEENYVDRHGDHSLNVLMISGPDRSFYYVNARWPGSVHDTRVMRNSFVCEKFDAGWRPFVGAVILGDSGYPLKDWLIPPMENNPNDPVERRFNRKHKITRSMVENAFGILQEKFPCLLYLRVGPERAAKIIMACATLHNIAKRPELEVLQVNVLNSDRGINVGADGDGREKQNELYEYFRRQEDDDE